MRLKRGRCARRVGLSHRLTGMCEQEDLAPGP